jgi:hypothetical protein
LVVCTKQDSGFLHAVKDAQTLLLLNFLLNVKFYVLSYLLCLCLSGFPILSLTLTRK